jgi:hypothetical protein
LVEGSEGSVGLVGLMGAKIFVRWRTFCLTESKRLPVSAAGTGWRTVIRFQTSANRRTNAATISGTPNANLLTAMSAKNSINAKATHKCQMSVTDELG